MEILITGSNGQLGQELQHLLASKNIAYDASDVNTLDITNEAQVKAYFKTHQPKIVYHCAAYTAVDKAEDEGKKLNYAVNALGTEIIAKACQEYDALLVYISTDYVFNGEKTTEYLPNDPKGPKNEYGRTKLLGEQAVQKYCSKYYIVSTPGRDPRGWVITIAHLVYLPKEAMNQVRAGDDANAAYFVDVDFKTGICSLNGQNLSAEDFAFDHYELIQESIRRIQGRLDWNPTFFHLLEEPFTVYEGTELVNAISAGKPILHNNFLVKYGQYLEEDGVRRIPKKKPKKTYRLKEEGHVCES